MAYMSQERKAKLAPAIKEILKRYGVKGSLSVDNHMSLVLTIKSSKLDFIKDYNETVGARPGGFRLGSPAEKSLDINQFWYQEHFKDKKILGFLREVLAAMNVGNHDRSDIQTDYFDVGWYINVHVGKWNKPYILEK